MTSYLQRLAQRAAGITPAERLQPAIQTWTSPATPDPFEPGEDAGLDLGPPRQPTPAAEPPVQLPAAPTQSPLVPPALKPDLPFAEAPSLVQQPSLRHDQPAPLEPQLPAHVSSPPSVRDVAVPAPVEPHQQELRPPQDEDQQRIGPQRYPRQATSWITEEEFVEPRSALQSHHVGGARIEAEESSRASQSPMLEEFKRFETPVETLQPGRVPPMTPSQGVAGPSLEPTRTPESTTQTQQQELTGNRIPASLLIPPSPELPPPRPEPEQPRLVIGSLRVEVVPTPREAPRPQPVRKVRAVKIARQRGSTQSSSKQRFGLGQM